MGLENWERTAATLKALGSVNRLKTFYRLKNGTPPKEIADELGISRAAMQPYINDFKENQLLVTDGKEYVITERGEQIAELVEEVDHVPEGLSEEALQLIEKETGLSREELRETLEGDSGQPEEG